MQNTLACLTAGIMPEPIDTLVLTDVGITSGKYYLLDGDSTVRQLPNVINPIHGPIVPQFDLASDRAERVP